MNTKPITSRELERILLTSWCNSHPNATKDEIAVMQWKAKKISYQERRNQDKIK
jgi:hypothetical protein